MDTLLGLPSQHTYGFRGVRSVNQLNLSENSFANKQIYAACQFYNQRKCNFSSLETGKCNKAQQEAMNKKGSNTTISRFPHMSMGMAKSCAK
jgi:hypothetical protein